MSSPDLTFMVRWLGDHLGLQTMFYLTSQAVVDAQRLREGATEDEAAQADALDQFFKLAGRDPRVRGEAIPGVRRKPISQPDADRVVVQHVATADFMPLSLAQRNEIGSRGRMNGLLDMKDNPREGWSELLAAYGVTEIGELSSTAADELLIYLRSLPRREGANR